MYLYPIHRQVYLFQDKVIAGKTYKLDESEEHRRKKKQKQQPFINYKHPIQTDPI